jgi:hypothetical protein
MGTLAPRQAGRHSGTVTLEFSFLVRVFVSPAEFPGIRRNGIVRGCSGLYS